jgi:hypothetical protein
MRVCNSSLRLFGVSLARRIGLWHVGFSAFAISALSLVSSNSLAAPVPAYDYTSVNGYGNSYALTQTMGFIFTPSEDFRVTALGFFDYLQDGLGETHELGIFDDSGSLLVSAFLPSGTTSPLDDSFRYVDITPIVLNAGEDYTAAAFFGTQADVVAYLDVGDLTVNPSVGLSAVPARYIYPSGTELTLPTETSGLISEFFFGPNFKLEPVQDAPIPPTPLLLAAGVALFWRSRRNKRGVGLKLICSVKKYIRPTSAPARRLGAALAIARAAPRRGLRLTLGTDSPSRTHG